jgi:hypothetical protein
MNGLRRKDDDTAQCGWYQKNNLHYCLPDCLNSTVFALPVKTV